ncbi:hypothetical protein EAF04_005989 [Stromatinia cepivora]|nr:hypothetical protein EAF04_005989 [Stromatinia cepivora]
MPMPYFSKAFNAPKKLSDVNQCSSDERKIQTSYAGSMSASEPISQAWLETFKRLNYATDDDPFPGVRQGAFSSLSSIDPATATRSYSANAYYTPVSGRQNLYLLTNAYVAKVLLESTDTSSELCATGVQYIKEAEVNVVRARKEVILASGTLQSPKLLELSVIGREELLRDHGIEVHQDLELIERAMEEYITTKRGPFVSPGFGPNAYLPIVEFLSEEGQKALAVLLDETKPEEKTTDDASSKYFAIVKDILQDAKDASASFPTVIVRTNIDDELPGNFLSILAILSMPLSRDTIADSEPLRSTVIKAGGQRSEPIAGFSTLDDAKDFIRNTAVSMWHPTSTCSMLPRELGGVVSPDLVVYGTSNLRIADASIMPLIPRANTQSTVYAVAERAADIIKVGHSL